MDIPNSNKVKSHEQLSLQTAFYICFYQIEQINPAPRQNSMSILFETLISECMMVYITIPHTNVFNIRENKTYDLRRKVKIGTRAHNKNHKIDCVDLLIEYF